MGENIFFNWIRKDKIEWVIKREGKDKLCVPGIFYCNKQNSKFLKELFFFTKGEVACACIA